MIKAVGIRRCNTARAQSHTSAPLGVSSVLIAALLRERVASQRSSH